MLRLFLLSTVLAVVLGASVSPSSTQEQPKEMVKSEGRAESVNSDMISKLVQTALTSQLGNLNPASITGMMKKLRKTETNVVEENKGGTRISIADAISAITAILGLLFTCICDVLTNLLGNPTVKGPIDDILKDLIFNIGRSTFES